MFYGKIKKEGIDKEISEFITFIKLLFSGLAATRMISIAFLLKTAYFFFFTLKRPKFSIVFIFNVGFTNEALASAS